MITQELVLFIKQQLQEGKSKEQIAGILTPHGWALEDINSVFTQIMPTAQPVTQMQQPVMQTMAQPVMTQTTAQATMTAQPVGVEGGFINTVRNPGALFAIMTIVITSIASTLAFSAIANKNHLTDIASQNQIIGIILASVFGVTIFSGLVVHLTTKILGLQNRSFPKAFVFTAVSMAASAIVSLTNLLGVSEIVPGLVGLIVWVLLFSFFYQAGIWKTIAAFFLNGVVSAIVGAALFFGVTALGIGVMTSVVGKYFAPASVQQKITENMAQVQLRQQAIQQEIDTMNIPMVDATTTAEIPAVTPAATSTALVTTDTAPVSENPEFSHVKDAFPVGFPLPKESEVITATVLSASTFEGLRYILDYSTTHSVAYMRNNIKSSLGAAGYTVSVNETNPDYVVIAATKVVRSTARSFRIILEKTPIDVTVHTVFTQ